MGWSSSSSQPVRLSKSTMSAEPSSSTFSSSESGIKPGSLLTEKWAKTILNEHGTLRFTHSETSVRRTVTCSRWRWWAKCRRDTFSPPMIVVDENVEWVSYSSSSESTAVVFINSLSTRGTCKQSWEIRVDNVQVKIQKDQNEHYKKYLIARGNNDHRRKTEFHPPRWSVCQKQSWQFCCVSHKQMMLLGLNLDHALNNVPFYRQIIEKIVVKVFSHSFLDTFPTLFDPTFVVDVIEFGAKASGFQYDLTIRFTFHCEWYFFVCRIEQLVILVIIRQIEQMFERPHIKVEIIGFYSIQRICVFAHDFEAISKPGFHFIIIKSCREQFLTSPV